MPILVPALQGLLNASLAGGGFIGTSAPLVATGIATGFATYATSSIIVNSIDVGTAGSGTGTGTGVILSAATLVGTLNVSFEAAQIRGTQKTAFVTAVATSISTTLVSALMMTTNVGVGVGTGRATLIGNSASHIGSMISNFTSAGLIGTKSRDLATAIATGIEAALPQAQGFIVISGSPSPSAGSGTGIGKLL